MIPQKTKIVCDSASDMLSLCDVAFTSAPLKIITDDNEYIDDKNLNVAEMANKLLTYKGKSSTACPSVGDWLSAFGDAEFIFCVTITSSLSGSYNSACIAKGQYEGEHPDRKVFIIDSLSAGPEIYIMIEKLREYILSDEPFDSICEKIMEYKKSTKLFFMLESMRNLANNGRVSPLVAKAAGLLGIRAIGTASDEGTLKLLDKCRGEQKALSTILQHIKKLGSNIGRVRIGHCNNETAARLLSDMIASEFKCTDILIYELRGLCSFYAENGGFLIGVEQI